MAQPDELIQIADAALADAYARAGDWMACRPGCSQCCVGVFPVTTLDIARLREGIAAAETDRRQRILERASASRARLAAKFPGDAQTGTLFTAPHH